MSATIEARRALLAAAFAARSDLKPSEAAALCDQQTLDLIASVPIRRRRQPDASDLRGRPKHFGARKPSLISGGVAANRELRRRFTAEAATRAA